MQVPFASHEDFDIKARQLSEALGVDGESARLLMATIAGYASAAQISTGSKSPEGRHIFSREELMARLQSECPNVDNERAARIIDSLALPTRDTRLEDIPESPDAAPNMGG
jgi:hypothetical protein